MEGKTEVTDEQIAEYVAKPYARILTPAEEGGYVVEVLEVPGVISEGDTADEAMAMIDDALGGIIAVMLEDGETIPEPIGFNEYSGRFNLRVSSDVHREAVMRAQVEGVSLNQWVGQAVVARLAGQSLADEVVEKLRGLMVTKETSQMMMVVQRTEAVFQLSQPDPEAVLDLGQIQWAEGTRERSSQNA